MCPSYPLPSLSGGKKSLDLNNALDIPASIRGKTRSGGGGGEEGQGKGGRREGERNRSLG